MVEYGGIIRTDERFFRSTNRFHTNICKQIWHWTYTDEQCHHRCVTIQAHTANRLLSLRNWNIIERYILSCFVIKSNVTYSVGFFHFRWIKQHETLQVVSYTYSQYSSSGYPVAFSTTETLTTTTSDAETTKPFNGRSDPYCVKKHYFNEQNRMLGNRDVCWPSSRTVVA